MTEDGEKVILDRKTEFDPLIASNRELSQARSRQAAAIDRSTGISVGIGIVIISGIVGVMVQLSNFRTADAVWKLNTERDMDQLKRTLEVETDSLKSSVISLEGKIVGKSKLGWHRPHEEFLWSLVELANPEIVIPDIKRVPDNLVP